MEQSFILVVNISSLITILLFSKMKAQEVELALEEVEKAGEEQAKCGK